MDHENCEPDNQLIELGMVSAETKGGVQGIPDIGGLPQKPVGIADD
jgi:hypothetical protein